MSTVAFRLDFPGEILVRWIPAESPDLPVPDSTSSVPLVPGPWLTTWNETFESPDRIEDLWNVSTTNHLDKHAHFRHWNVMVKEGSVTRALKNGKAVTRASRICAATTCSWAAGL